MRAGELRHKIIIQNKAITTDSYGGPVESWGTFATLWAKKIPVSGKELIASNAEKGSVTVRFLTRWITGVTHDMRVSFNGEYYDIKFMLEDESRGEMQLLTTKGVNEG